MSLLSKLKDAVVEEDVPSAKVPQPAPTSPTPTQVPNYIPTPPISAPGPIQTSDAIDVNMRLKVAGAGSSTVFSATLKSLAAYIPDEASRYKAAKDMLATQGVTPITISAGTRTRTTD